MMKRIRHLFLFLVLAIASSQLFVNCGVVGPAFDENQASTIPGDPVPLDHPGMKETTPPTVKLNLAPREYVFQLLKEVFTSSTGATPGDLEGLLIYWILQRPAAFGGNCNLYESTSGRDCGGSTSNAALAPLAEPSATRASYKVQACEQILSNDLAITYALEKIKLTTHTPNADAIGQIYSLFRRGWDPDATFVQTLVQLDHDLAAQSASEMDRWRMVLLMTCEDPMWEAL